MPGRMHQPRQSKIEVAIRLFGIEGDDGIEISGIEI